MKVVCICPTCSKSYQVGREHLGRQARCRHCGQTIVCQQADASTNAVSPQATLAEAASPASEGGTDSPIGRFEIRRRLGAGAFGTVYLAFDPVLDRDVALKVPHRARVEDARDRARMLREAKAAARLHHPNIVPLYEADAGGSRFYTASAYVEGQTLEAAAAKEPLDCGRAARIVMRLAEALEHAHRLGIVHRDVKPQNVMLDAQGEPMLMDFGLARLAESESQLTHEGAILGTPAYMSPEQARGKQEEVSPSSDQYSLGVVLYRLLCGKTPFGGASASVLAEVLNQEPPAPRTMRREIPKDLETICLKAMAKSPQDRYPDCRAMAEDLRRWLADEPIRARRAGPAERLGRWCRRNPTLATLSAIAAALLVLMALVPSLAYWRITDALAMADSERDRADNERQRAQEQEAVARREAERASQQKVLAKSLAARAEEQAALAERRARQAQQQEKIAQEALAKLRTETEARKAAEAEKQAEASKRESLAKELDQKSKALQSAEGQAKSAEQLRQEANEAGAWAAYTDDLKAADRAFAKNRRKQMFENLNACPEKHRGWEWHYLKALAGGRLPTVMSIRLQPYQHRRGGGVGMVQPHVLGSSHDGVWLLSTIRSQVHPLGAPAYEEDKVVNLHRLPQASPVMGIPWNVSRGIINEGHSTSALVSPTGQSFLFLYTTPEKPEYKTSSIALCSVVGGRVVPIELPNMAGVLGKGRTPHELLGRRMFAFSPDGKFLVVCWSEKLTIFDAITGRLLRQMADWHFMAPPCFTPDGELAVLIKEAAQSSLFLWRIGDKKPPRTIELPSKCALSGSHIAISRDGTLWAMGGSVVNLANGTAIHGIRGDPLAFSPDGKRLAVVDPGPDNNVLLWDIGSQRALPRLETFCRNGVYDPDWTRIITIGVSEAQVWTMRPVAVPP